MLIKDKNGNVQIFQYGNVEHKMPSDQSIVKDLHRYGILKFYHVGKQYHGWKLFGVKDES